MEKDLEKNKLKRAPILSSFSIIILFVMMMVVGVSIVPLLNVQLSPSESLLHTEVRFNWGNASARVVEQEVTTKLEGVLNQIKGVRRITSVSNKGNGKISVDFKKGVNVDAVRFEMAMIIRQVFSQLPEGVSYPSISISSAGENITPVLTFTLNANASPLYIQQFAEKNVAPKLALVKGVNEVNVIGGNPFEWVITFDAPKIATLGISPSDISMAINNYFQDYIVGVMPIENNDDKALQVILKVENRDSVSWNDIPIKKVSDRIVFLRDIAVTKYQERQPQSYYRINGLNTVNLVIYPEKEANNIKLAGLVKEKMNEIEQHLPPGYSAILAYDSTRFIKEELQKIGFRTLFSLLVLLLFVILISRKLRYLFLILASILANLIIAVIFYYLFKVEIHLYALAGITVSFGIIIDNSIIMIDHIRHRGNRKVFLAIFAATLTTIGALSVIFFLKENQKINLIDFSLVVIINLSVSMLVALFFIPALLEKLPLRKKTGRRMIKRKRRIIKATLLYSRFILFSKKFKWAFLVISILGFGIPVQWLPNKIEADHLIAIVYNETLGSDWFNNEAKPELSKVIGGSLRLFTENVFENSFYAEPDETKLYLRGSMPEGCTIDQLNSAIIMMEHYISQYDEVKLFQTSIYSPQNASIVINFKEEAEFGGFPYFLKEELTSKAIGLGGLDWSVYGVGRGFSNALRSGYKSNQIILEGYNYDQLYAYAEQLKARLSENPRANDIEIGGSTRWRGASLQEFYLDFVPEDIALYNISLSQTYKVLHNKLYYSNLNPIFYQDKLQYVSLKSSEYDHFSAWDLKNQPVAINNKQYKLSRFATIDKQATGNSIYKSYQQYQLVVAYDFIGPGPLAQMVREENVKNFSEVVPLGYKVFEQNRGGWNRKDKHQYLLIFLIIGIIFFICSILLESFTQPLAIIGMIPISFIGVFLTFYLFDFNFDQGGFASFILLCGIVVNAGLYILNDYNNLRKVSNRTPLQCYLNAYNNKIVPILLTILSTILGLVPFVWGGQKEVFWFSFAVGAMGGLIFSLIALLLYLPLFLKMKVKSAANAIAENNI